MDMTRMIAPRSDQKNADDFALSGPRTFTITDDIEYESTEQPLGLVLDGDDSHPYKPGKSMGRVLVAAWGLDSAGYVGKRLTLYTDPTVRFGPTETGGIRISHMSHIAKPVRINLTVKKGTKAPFTVQPLTDPAPVTAPTADDIAACTDLDTLRDMFDATTDHDLKALLRARKVEITASMVGGPS